MKLPFLLIPCLLLPWALAQSSLDSAGAAGDVAMSPLTANGTLNQIGTVYCENPGKKLFTFGSLRAFGSTVAAANDVLLVAEGLPFNAMGYFLIGETQDFVPNPGNNLGDLCLGGKLGRLHRADQVFNTGSGSMASLQLDLTDFPMNPSQMVMAGETWCFQGWYQFIPGAAQPGLVSTFTEAVQITFQ
ncbi:MAG: hypothetical protein R3F33_00625 [Planctomycetota bacterium]